MIVIIVIGFLWFFLWGAGQLKKMLTEYTGLHVEDQKLIFKKKVIDSKSYLDVERVKDGSKLVLIEDIESRERRVLEKLKIANKEKTSKSLIKINLEVENLAKKVNFLFVTFIYFIASL